MFSGIIERLSKVQNAAQDDGKLILTLETGYPDLTLGESVAVNGVCLTVVEFDTLGLAKFFVSAETIARSNLGLLSVGDFANLERSVRLETRLSGHLVQGHVDGKARLTAATLSEGAYLLELTLPRDVARYCVEKGSIALNGISLTLNAVEDSADHSLIRITIIPHTWEHTNLQHLKIGSDVNVEVDVMAKYVERLCHAYL
ncbi:MAG: riboflavin synthase [Cypionkella sp.]